MLLHDADARALINKNLPVQPRVDEPRGKRRQTERIIVSASISVTAVSRSCPMKPQRVEKEDAERTVWATTLRFTSSFLSRHCARTNRFSVVDFDSRSRPDDRAISNKKLQSDFSFLPCYFSRLFLDSRTIGPFVNAVNHHAIGKLYLPRKYGKRK